jgi:hypothetical protein
MADEKPTIALLYPASCPDDAMEEFLTDLAEQGIAVPVRRDDRWPMAGLEDWLVTLAAVYLAKPFFESFLKEAGRDAYVALKRSIARFWPVFFGKDRQVRVRVAASAPKKLSSGRFSRAFSLMARTSEGMIKLALRDDATREELDEAIATFLALLEQVYAGNGPALRYRGGIALVAYDRDRKSLYFPEPEAPSGPTSARAVGRE